MAKNTTNLGLYEKESTDGSDTFNIQTMLNDNWDKIDVDSKAKADALTNLAGEGRTAETVKGNADAINALAGEGNTTTVKAVDDALKSHLSDTSSHITSTERATWNAKQAALGYVPVQQGGGTGQLGNKVYIGWDGSKLKAQVDALDLGRLLTESDYDQLFQFANDGKTGIANAVTAKGVAASPTDTFATLATKIGQINTGKRYASGIVTSSTTTLTFRDKNDYDISEYYVNVSYNFGFAPRYIIVSTAGVFTIYSYSRFFREDQNDVYCLMYDGVSMEYYQHSNIIVNSNGFQLPFGNDNLSCAWEVFE